MTTRISIVRRSEDYSQWYLDVIAAGDLAQNSPTRGSMVIKPRGYAIWERVHDVLDPEFKKTGVQNAYFPALIPLSVFNKEKESVEGFSPQVAVVTHGGGSELGEPLVLRPTSETIMYEVFKDWIQSYRDLPLLINQWANVFRWEMRTRPFLRTLEFLWQEGHTVHISRQEAWERTLMMLKIYHDFAHDVLAMPVIMGKKTPSERFPAADETTTIEAMMQDGEALQAGTSHLLGQKLARAYNIRFQTHEGDVQYGWQTSWGMSTRIIGALVMTHSDDKGLILPPRIAPWQVRIIVIGLDERVREYARGVERMLAGAGVRVEVDDRDLRPGPRFVEWEHHGVPVRIEIGAKEIGENKAMMVQRDTENRISVPIDELCAIVLRTLEEIQGNLLHRARDFQTAHSQRLDSYEDLKRAGGFSYAHWCGDSACEKKAKDELQITIRCIPFDQNTETGQCVVCNKPTSGSRVIFAKSY